ncbi:MAG: hypothetical protein LWW86_11945 [Micrococcales bacterium]|nr:hypothetical protein [Micrococcales bacterium]
MAPTAHTRPSPTQTATALPAESPPSAQLGHDGQAEEEDLQGQGGREDDPLGQAQPRAQPDEDAVEEQVDHDRRQHADGQGHRGPAGRARDDPARPVGALLRLELRALGGGLLLGMPPVGPQAQHQQRAGHEAQDGPDQVPLGAQLGHDLADQRGQDDTGGEVLDTGDETLPGRSQCRDRGARGRGHDREGHEQGGLRDEVHLRRLGRHAAYRTQGVAARAIGTRDHTRALSTLDETIRARCAVYRRLHAGAHRAGRRRAGGTAHTRAHAYER